MEKWKILLIALLLGGLVGYGALSNQKPAPMAAGNPQPEETPAPSALEKWVGKTPPAWDVPQNLWVNTPKPLKLDDLKGHVTLIEFFRTECSHCQEAAPHLAELARTLGPKGFRIVAFQSPGQNEDGSEDASSPETRWADVKRWVKERGLPYPVAFDTHSKIFKKSYGGKLYPSMLLLDKQGIARFAQSGHTEEKAARLDAAINKMLAE